LAQVEECNCKVLSSNTGIAKKKKKKNLGAWLASNSSYKGWGGRKITVQGWPGVKTRDPA
jgi:hypothetical protein